MLRFAGDKDRKRLVQFLDKYADQMKNTLKVSDLKVSDFVAVFYPGV